MKATIKAIQRAGDHFDVTLVLDDIEATYRIAVTGGPLWTVRAEDTFWRAFESLPLLATEILDVVLRFARDPSLALPLDVECRD